MKFQRIVLLTNEINRMKEFYTKELKLTLVIEEENRFSVKVGETELQFNEDQIIW